MTHFATSFTNAAVIVRRLLLESGNLTSETRAGRHSHFRERNQDVGPPKRGLIARLLLSLLFGDESGTIGDDASCTALLLENYQAIISLSKDNGVEVPVLKRLCDILGSAEPRVSHVYRVSRRRYEEFWKSAKLYSEILTRAGVESILIKTARKYEFYDWDVDLLIRRGNLEQGLQALRRAGFRLYSLRGVPSRLWSWSEPEKFFLKGPREHPVDLHTGISWHVRYLPDDLVWSDTVTGVVEGERYRLPSHTLDLLIHCAHSVFEKCELTLGELYHLTRVMGEEHVDMARMRRIASENGWENGLKLFLQTIPMVLGPTHDGGLIALPYRYPSNRLLSAWSERLNDLLRNRDPKGFLSELCWQPASYLYRAISAH